MGNTAEIGEKYQKINTLKLKIYSLQKCIDELTQQKNVISCNLFNWRSDKQKLVIMSNNIINQKTFDGKYAESYQKKLLSSVKKFDTMEDMARNVCSGIDNQIALINNKIAAINSNISSIENQIDALSKAESATK